MNTQPKVRWVCPICRATVRTFWHNGVLIFTAHGGDVLRGECCEASGWLVEDDDARVEVPRGDH